MRSSARSRSLLLGSLAATLAALAAVPAQALDPAKSLRQYSLDVWDVRDGLPSNAIHAVCRTRDGYLWLGTNAGLVRFDGVRFALFDSDGVEAFNNNRVQALAEDADGVLWIGIWGGGVVRYKDGVFERVGQELSAVLNVVFSIAPAWDRRVLLGGSAGLAVYDKGRVSDLTWQLGRVTGSVMAIAVDPRSRTLWLGHSEGLISVRDGRSHHYTRRDGLSTEQIVALHRGANGDLWIGTRNGGLNRLRDGRFQSFTMRDGLPSDNVLSVLEDRDGNLWVGTTGGLARLSGDRFTSLSDDEGLPHETVSALHEDGEGSLWVGTDGGGLARLKDGLFTSFTTKEGLPDDGVNAVLESRDGSVWIGTDAGLGRLGESGLSVLRKKDGLPDDRVMSLWENRQGLLWVGTEDGLACVSGGRVIPHPAVDGLRRSYEGRFWIRALRQAGEWLWIFGPDLRRIRVSDGVVETVPRTDGSSTTQGLAIAEAAGRVWLGTYDGLLEADEGGKTTTHTLYMTKDGGSRGVPHAILADRDGTLWVGTRDRGLFRVKGDKLASYTTANGLPSNEINSVLADDSGNLWLGTSRSLCRVSKDDLDRIDAGSLKQARVISYGVSDGLRTSETGADGWPTAWRGRDGRLWFCTKRGVAVVDPRRVGGDLSPTPVVIQTLVANGKPQDARDGMEVPPGRGDVEIRYAGLSLLAPEKILFRYRLDGVDDTWVEAGTRRVAYYTHLAPGRYAFRVQASDREGGFEGTAATVTFRLQPHWTQTTWFKLLLVLSLLLAGLLLTAGIYRYRVRALKQRERELALKVEERTTDLSREIAEHKKTEERLASENAERQRAEQESRGYAEKLAQSNVDLLDNQRALEDKQAALERENEERRRAEEAARLSAEKLAQANTDLVENQRALEDKQAALERENEERRRAEEAAGRERDLLHALMDNIPDLIYFKDTDSRFTRINRAHADALGIARPEEALGKNDFAYYPPEFARVTRDGERELIATGQPIVGQIEHEDRAGRWYLATKVPIRDSSGAITGLVGISKDVTERRLTEEKLERDLAALLDVVSSVAQGDLTRRGQPDDDTLGRIAHSINEALDSFATILTEVRDGAFSVSSSASQILAAAMEIAKGAQYGSDQVNSTSSAVEEMAASMGQVSRNAEASAAAANQVLEHITEGDRAVGETSRGIERIDAAVGETAEKMRLLEDRSREIFEIIGLIEELASQSNLLSLNAAIEAAHAGEAGRGFGVVADEIRRLAERSTEATKDVTVIVKKIVAETRAVLGAMERAMSEVKEGRELSERAQGSLREIQSLVETSANLAQQISNASREQAGATRTVAEAMQTIANISQESAAGANETTKAVRDLVSLSEHLTKAISRFRIENGRHKG